MNRINFCILEDTYVMPCGIVNERWFITRSNGKNPVRRETYKTNTGYIVAFCDRGAGIDNSLYMEQNFFEYMRGEPEFEAILKDQVILDPDLVKTYRME